MTATPNPSSKTAPRLPIQAAPLLFVVLIDSLSYSIVLPFLPSMILQHGGGVLLGGLLVALPAFCTMVSAPLLGRLADRAGSRRVLLFTLAGAVASYAMLATAQSLVVLFAARALAGTMAGNLAVVQAAMARTSNSENRARAMGLITAMWALGFVLGPALGAIVAAPGRNPALAPSLVAASATLISMLSVLLWRGIDPPATDAEGPGGAGSAAGTPTWLFGLTGLLALVQTGLVAITGFFVTDLLGWSAKNISFLMLGIAMTIVVVQIAGIPRLVKRLGERGGLASGLVLGILGCLTITLAPKAPGVMVGAPLLFASITVGQTSIMTLLSRSTAFDRQGAVMGRANAIQAGGRIIGPIAFGALYASVAPTAPYTITALLMSGGLLFCGLMMLRLRGAPGP